MIKFIKNLFKDNRPKCPECNRAMVPSEIWMLNNGTEVHARCWPEYFSVKGGEAIDRVFKTKGKQQ